MSKYLIKGAIRVVIEADSHKEAESILNGALLMMVDGEEIEDWDEITIEDPIELDEDVDWVGEEDEG